MTEVPQALPRLAVGSYDRGSGKACIMNAISYLNGDAKITDMPDCAHPVLARAASAASYAVASAAWVSGMHQLIDEFERLTGTRSHNQWTENDYNKVRHEARLPAGVMK